MSDPVGAAADSGDDGLRWTDDHCHLHFRDADAGSVAEAVADARAAGVVRMVTVGCDVADSQGAIAVAAAHDGVFATAGVHPHEAEGGIDGLEALLASPEVVAVGSAVSTTTTTTPRGTRRSWPSPSRSPSPTPTTWPW